MYQHDTWAGLRRGCNEHTCWELLEYVGFGWLRYHWRACLSSTKCVVDAVLIGRV